VHKRKVDNFGCAKFFSLRLPVKSNKPEVIDHILENGNNTPKGPNYLDEVHIPV